MLAFTAAAVLFSGVAAHAQPDNASPTETSPPVAPTATSAVANEIVLGIDRFGVGNQARAGDWIGVNISAVDSNPKQRDVILSIVIPDADGDSATYARVVTLNPGTRQTFWVYLRLPFNALGSNLTGMLEAHEAITSDAEQDRVLKARPGRMLGQTPIGGGTLRVLEPSVGMACVLGQRSAGLRAYADRDQPTQTYLTLGHEVTEIAEGLSAADLPDRWQGLAAFDAVFWLGADISALRGEAARALREWVHRGGHLIISLPAVGSAWTTPSSNELIDLLPAVKISRRENVDLEPYKAIFTSARDRFIPRSATLHDLIPREDARPDEAVSLISGPDGRCLVSRRIVDAGMVTLIGVDLSTRGISDAIDADMFWHRILGKRGKFVPAAQKAGVSQNLSRPVMTVDGGLHEEIAKKGQTAAAVLLGLVVFAAYWLAAGPLGYAVLKKTNRIRHAWLAYVLTAGAFTALAWSGATALRPRRVEAAHVTFLDHIYGQPQQRARTWASILTPTYGTASIQIGGPNAKIEETTETRAAGNIASAWESPTADGARTQFPDARPYIVDGRNPSAWNVPSRATVKQFQFEWAGGPRWGMPHPVAPEGGTERDGLRLVGNKLQGTLVHNLPGELQNVVVMYVRRQQPINFSSTSAPKFDGSAVKFNAWPVGAALNVGDLFSGTSDLAFRYLDDLVPKQDSMFAAAQSTIATPRLLDSVAQLSFYSLLRTPDATSKGEQQTFASMQRVLTHGWDISRWSTQPCLIIVGTIGGDTPLGRESPTPVYVDGVEIKMTGRTVVRWIYPLDAAPPDWNALPGPTPAAPPGKDPV
ncbi:MAG: hypothetical protein SFY96_09535 [Planctomycetota bacterium]|nr:hypothetical protein [Planctomycetota bacterium]